MDFSLITRLASLPGVDHCEELTCEPFPHLDKKGTRTYLVEATTADESVYYEGEFSLDWNLLWWWKYDE